MQQRDRNVDGGHNWKNVGMRWGIGGVVKRSIKSNRRHFGDEIIIE